MYKKQKEQSIDSFSEAKLNASKIINQQFKDIIKNPITNCGIVPSLFNDDDIFTWRTTLVGAKDTSYRGGLFYLKIIFPENYPQSAPDIIFLTPIYHLNVNPFKGDYPEAEKLGHVSVSFLNWWNPKTTVREMLTKLFTIFYMANPDSPYGLDKANEFKNNRLLYEEKVKYFTKKYANPLKSWKNYDKTWDFYCNENELYIDNNYNIKKSNTNNYNNKENMLINVKFIYNGNKNEEITIQCNKNELIKDLIERFKKKLNINDDKHFFIWNGQKLEPELYVGQTSLNNNLPIDVIDTKDIIYA